MGLPLYSLRGNDAHPPSTQSQRRLPLFAALSQDGELERFWSRIIGSPLLTTPVSGNDSRM